MPATSGCEWRSEPSANEVTARPALIPKTTRYAAMSRPDTGRGYPGRRDRAKRAVLAASRFDGTSPGRAHPLGRGRDLRDRGRHGDRVAAVFPAAVDLELGR